MEHLGWYGPLIDEQRQLCKAAVIPMNCSGLEDQLLFLVVKLERSDVI